MIHCRLEFSLLILVYDGCIFKETVIGHEARHFKIIYVHLLIPVARCLGNATSYNHDK